MSLSELAFVLLVASVGIGYGVREYGLFIATLTGYSESIIIVTNNG